MADVFNFYVYDDRTIRFELAEPIMLEDLNVTEFKFRIPKSINGFDMSGWAWWFVYENASKEKYSASLLFTDDEDEPDEYANATYTVDYGMSGTAGTISFALEAINADATTSEILNEWHTKTYTTKVLTTLQGNQTEFTPSEFDIISANLEEILELIEGGIGGTSDDIENASSVSGSTVSDALETLSGEIASKLTASQIAAIDGMFRACAYAKDATAEYAAFCNAFDISYMHITYNLRGVTSSNTDTAVREGEPYTTNLSTDYGINPASIAVTMGGVNITASVVSGASISIPSVTGDVTITATLLPSGYTQYDYIANTVANSNSVAINTKIDAPYASPSYNHEITLKFHSGFATDASAVAGIRKQTGNTTASRTVWQKSGSLAANYNGADTGYTVPVQENTKYTIKTADGYLYVDGVQTQAMSGTFESFTSSVGLCLFGIGRNGAYDQTKDKYKLYSYIVADAETDAYVAVLIPCINNSTSAPGVYDVIRNAFYTCTTPANLTCGND